MRTVEVFGKQRDLLIPALILLFFIFALAIRAIPVLSTPSSGFIPIDDPDTWFTLRQVEVMVHAFPQYNWFDPMTAYPTGKFMDWGPLYPALAAVLGLAAGASTRSEIVAAAMWLGPLLGACMVPVMYLLGKVVWNWKVGIVAAALASFTSFRFFFLSSYGFVDHHIAEILITTLFLLSYCAVLSWARHHSVRLADRRSLLTVGGLSLLCGLLFFAALLTSTTVVFVAIAIGIYTAVQMVADTLEHRPVYALVLLNTVLFMTGICLLLIFGFRAEGLSLYQYSAGHVLVYGTIIAETWILAAISWAARGRRHLFLALLGAALVAAFLLLVSIPPLRVMAFQGIGFLSGTEAASLGIGEMLPWTLESALGNLNVFLLLMAGGFVVLALGLLKERRAEWICIGIWAAFFLTMTVFHKRFEYYLSVPLILLSALCVVETFSYGYPDLKAWVGEHRRGKDAATPSGTQIPDAKASPRRTSGKKKKSRTPGPVKREKAAGRVSHTPALLAILVLILLAAGSLISIGQSIEYGMGIPNREINDDWLETLSWMNDHTPPTGVDYFGRYEKGYVYPPGSYGVMSGWESGHWITFFARRIPNVNPFQDHLAGESGGAAFFLTPSEARGEEILTGLGTRYVVTDALMATARFSAQIPWVDPAVNTTPYFRWFFVGQPSDPHRLRLQSFYNDGYYQSLLVRLHFFDGSMTEPSTVRYAEYVVRQVPGAGETAPVSTVGAVLASVEERDVTTAIQDAQRVNADPTSGHRAAVVSALPTQPLSKVAALTHFRLVHESPSPIPWMQNGRAFPLEGTRYVKVFEHVPGARIRGTGIIELPLVTNTGRTFTYRQESVNGEFVVPYSTRGNPYDVKATGPYRIAGTSKSYDVSEEDVLSGNTVG